MNTKLIFLFAAIAVSNILYSQGTVDKFTGDFIYSVPLINIPVANYSSYPLGARYRSDIKMDEYSGSLGLGWSLSGNGKVSRKINGYPDDWINKLSPSLRKGHLEILTGALKFNEFHHTDLPSLLDIGSSRFKLDTLPDSVAYRFPNFDSYYVEGMLSGEITPSYFDFASIERHEVDSNFFQYLGWEVFGYYYQNDTIAYDSIQRYFRYSKEYGEYHRFDTLNSFSKKAQFHFNDEINDTIDSKHYPWSSYPQTSSDTIYLPGYDLYDEAFNGSGYNDENYFFPYNQNRLRTSKFIEYFTNDEIETHKNSQNGTISGGFIEYSDNYSRTSSSIDPAGIGAFRITEENGITYHYSLPAYVNYRIGGTYDLTNDFQRMDYSSNTSKNSQDGHYLIVDSMLKNVSEYRDSSRFAPNWLLSAITGPDFIDNGNEVVDSGDKGYWIRFSYHKQNSSHIQRSPAYGFEPTMMGGGGDPFDRGEYDELYNDGRPVWYDNYNSKRIASFSHVSHELYYLDSIETSSHIATLHYQDRKDEISSIGDYEENGWEKQSANDYPSTSKKLSLEKILLIERSSGDSIQKVLLDQDYSLCKGYYKNENVRIDSSTKLSNPIEVRDGLTIKSGQYDESGKLTLNAINYFGDAEEKLTPGYLFDYQVSDSLKNPDYNPLRTDHWGNYQNREAGKGLAGYRSDSLVNYSDAWSLRKVTNPLGGVSEITYESDRYNHVINDGVEGGYRGPIRTFALEDANFDHISSGKAYIKLESDLEEFKENIINASNNSAIKMLTVIPCTGIDSVFDPQYIIYEYYTFLGGSFNSTYNDTIYSLYVNDSGPWDTTLAEGYNYLYDTTTTYHYTGNGYISFFYPDDHEILGGGTRVTNVQFSTENSETYSTNYTYSDGVALNEAGSFERPLFVDFNHPTKSYELLSSKRSYKNKLGGRIGYSKVVQEYKGEIGYDKSQGKTQFYFQTSDDGFSYMSPNFISKLDYVSRIDSIDESLTHLESIHFLEIADKFTSVWGKLNRTEITDNSGNIIDRKNYYYEHPSSKAFVNTYNFKKHFKTVNGMGGARTYHHINDLGIIRKFNSRLYKIEDIHLGHVKSIEYLGFNEFTGVPDHTRTTDRNAGEKVAISNAAHTQLSYLKMGPKSVLWSNKNLLNSEFENVIYQDSNLASNGDFALSETTCWSNKSSIRLYSYQQNRFIDSTKKVNWYPRIKYSWRGSLGKYGLYSNSSYSKLNLGVPISNTWINSLSGSFYKSGNWISRDSEGTAVSSSTLQNSSILLFDKDVYDDDLSELTLDSDILLYSVSDFEGDFETLETEDWPLSYAAGLIANNSNLRLWSNSNNPNKWKLTSVIFRQDEFGNVLEVRDHKQRSTAARFYFDGLYQLSVCTNSNFSSFTSCGFEDRNTIETIVYYEGEIKTSNTDFLNDTSVHSGNQYIGMAPNGKIEYRVYSTDNFQGGRTYRASVWVKSNSSSATTLKVSTNGRTSGSDVSESVTIGDSSFVACGNWNLLYMDVYIPTELDTAQVLVEVYPTSGTAYIDDFRFHSIDSKLEVQIIDSKTGMVSAVLDNNNYATRLEYDNQNRIISVKKDVPNIGKVVVQKRDYNFSRGL